MNFILDFADRIYHVDCKDAKVRVGDGRRGRLVVAPALGRPAPRLGLHLHRARRRAVGGLLPGAQRDRLRRSDLDRVGGRRRWTGWSARPEALEFVRRLAVAAADRRRSTRRSPARTDPDQIRWALSSRRWAAASPAQ